MIGANSEATAARLREPVAARATERDLVRLILLRELEDAGPLTGMQALDAVTSLACYLDVSRPVYALLHEMRDAGLLTTPDGRPPRYAISERGHREAERLAWRCWPRLRDVLVDLNVCIGCLSPRDAGPMPGRWLREPREPGLRMGEPGLTVAVPGPATPHRGARPTCSGSCAEPSPALG